MHGLFRLPSGAHWGCGRLSIVLTLSVIDTHDPTHSIALARHVEAQGFHRYWATEHYARGQSASPTVVASVVAASTRRLRVGTGGIMLRHASPVRVATDFQLLASLFPGRVDVGVIGNRVSDENLSQRLLIATETFAQRTQQLSGMLRDPEAIPGGFAPRVGPELWVCGVSRATAELAGACGAGFAYGHYMSQFVPKATQPDAPLDGYRNAFAGIGVPRTIVCCFGACADNRSVAESYWQGLKPAVPSFMGTAEESAEQIQEICYRYGSGEAMIQCFAPRLEQRLDAYTGIAAAIMRGRVLAAPTAQ